MSQPDAKASAFDISLPRNISSTHTLCGNDHLSSSKNNLVITSNYSTSDEYKKAREMYENLDDLSIAAKYDLAVMYYDGLGGPQRTLKAVGMLKDIVLHGFPEDIVQCACYNIGRSYYEGIGVKQSDEIAESWWLKASEDGKPGGCVKAMTVLGMFYSRPGEQNFDLDKSHYWHAEATGSGSIESQAALGVMYEYGIHVEKNIESSFKCFKSAAERGNIYAMGHLAFQYFRHKMFKNASEVARRVGLLQDTHVLSQQTDCLEVFIRKGIAISCFVYGRCLERNLIHLEDKEHNAIFWYRRATGFDMDIALLMQDLIRYGKI